MSEPSTPENGIIRALEGLKTTVDRTYNISRESSELASKAFDEAKEIHKKLQDHDERITNVESVVLGPTDKRYRAYSPGLVSQLDALDTTIRNVAQEHDNARTLIKWGWRLVTVAAGLVVLASLALVGFFFQNIPSFGSGGLPGA